MLGGRLGQGRPCPAVPSVTQKGADVQPAPPAGVALPPLPSPSTAAREPAQRLRDPVSWAAAPTCLFPPSLSRPQNAGLHHKAGRTAQEGWSVSPEPSVPRGQGPPDQPPEAHTSRAPPPEHAEAPSFLKPAVSCPDPSLTLARTIWQPEPPFLMSSVGSWSEIYTTPTQTHVPLPALPTGAQPPPCCPLTGPSHQAAMSP